MKACRTLAAALPCFDKMGSRRPQGSLDLRLSAAPPDHHQSAVQPSAAAHPVHEYDGSAVYGTQRPTNRGGVTRRPCHSGLRAARRNRLRVGSPAIAPPEAWGPRAPALTLRPPAGQAELRFLSGRREPLPAGWKPLAWNPAGRELLMASSTSLGIWSAARPAKCSLMVEPIPSRYRLGPTSRRIA